MVVEVIDVCIEYVVENGDIMVFKVSMLLLVGEVIDVFCMSVVKF